jgi:hypothetical protein
MDRLNASLAPILCGPDDNPAALWSLVALSYGLLLAEQWANS